MVTKDQVFTSLHHHHHYYSYYYDVYCLCNNLAIVVNWILLVPS